jgi:hypothetical protein
VGNIEKSTKEDALVCVRVCVCVCVSEEKNKTDVSGETRKRDLAAYRAKRS